MGDMQELLKALADASDDATADKIAELLETAEAARETKQTERANDYCSQAIDLVEGCLPAKTRAAFLEKLDGSTEKIEELVEAGEHAEQALNVLVMLSQLLQLRGELGMDKAQFDAARADLSEAFAISVKISDDVAAARCRRSEGMLLLMRKDIKGAEEALGEAIQLCRSAGDGKAEVETVKLVVQLHEGRDSKFDYCCELFHHSLEALQADGDMEAVNSTLLLLGQFRLRKHLSDTESGKEMEFAQLEMTDLDIQGAVTYFQAQLDEAGDSAGEAEDGLRSKMAGALTASGTIKMLLGDQPGAEAALKSACKLYKDMGDDEGEQSADALLSDVTRIMNKVDSTSTTPIS
jgi:tetratricopeptide (TPR) repeat protein